MNIKIPPILDHIVSLLLHLVYLFQLHYVQTWDYSTSAPCADVEY